MGILRPRAAAWLLVGALLACPPGVAADEGMWTLDNPPRAQWRARYQFSPSDEFLEQVRLAAARLGDGGSGSFVSPDGLLLTNQHVARSQVQKLSTPQRNLLHDGYYARTREAELRCPDLEVLVLWSYEDVTARVRAAMKARLTDAEAGHQRKAAIAAIEAASTQETGLRSEVVTLYGGGQYWLYRYKRYTDVRLVFVPEEQAAMFGGAYDNFTYPRYALDLALLRVYQDNRPLRTPHFLHLNPRPVAEGEMVLVAGHPGSTSRGLTVAQLLYQRDVDNPLQLRILKARRAALLRFGERGDEAARRVQALRLRLENSLKRLEGQQAGLQQPDGFARRQRAEQMLRAAVAHDPAWRAAYSDAWGRIAAAYRELPAYGKRLAYSTLLPSQLGALAMNLVLYAIEVAKPDARRYEEFRDSRLESMRFYLRSPAPLFPDVEEAVLTDWLEQARAALGDGDPFVAAALQGRPPAEVAHAAVAGTRLLETATRQALLDEGQQAILGSDDAMLVLARRIEPVLRALRSFYDEHVRSVELAAGQQIAAARFAVYGSAVYPDATFTLRLSCGQVLGYQKDTRLVPYQTMFYGLLDRALSFNEKPPYNLPPRLRAGLQRIDLATPLNFVYTADTIGGNSGSPVLNRAGELVGLNFDSNLEKLPNRYWYVDDSVGSRAIAVHAVAILEALGKVYGAPELVTELLGRNAPLNEGGSLRYQAAQFSP